MHDTSPAKCAVVLESILLVFDDKVNENNGAVYELAGTEASVDKINNLKRTKFSVRYVCNENGYIWPYSVI